MSSAQQAVESTNNILQRLKAVEDELKETKKEVVELKQTLASNACVAFTAQLGEHLYNLGSKQPIKFDRVITNIGSGYNALTGLFTCPCNGQYIFIATLMCHDNTFNELELMVNGVQKMIMYAGCRENRHNQGTNSVVVPLKSSDVVWIQTVGYPATSEVYGGGFSSFSGVKLA